MVYPTHGFGRPPQTVWGRTALRPQYNNGINNNGITFTNYYYINSMTGDIPHPVRTVKNADGSSTQYNSDGTYVIGDCSTYGNMYNPNGNLTYEWTRQDGVYIGKDYDENGRVTCIQNKVENENGEIDSDVYTRYEYGDNGNVTLETTDDLVSGEKTTVKYDENGDILEKFIQKGAVTTYYNAEGKPIRQETDKGQGVVVTEDLTE